MFKPVPIEISNNYNFPIDSHPFSIGVPCPEGAIVSQEHLKLNFKGQSKPFNVTPLANWPDGSMKWILLDFQASMEANEQSLLQLVSDRTTDNHFYHQSEKASIVTSDTGDECLVDTGSAQFIVSKHRLGLFDQVIYDNTELLSDVPSSIQLIDQHGNPATSIITTINFSDSENTLRKKVNIDGFFQSTCEENLVDYNLKLTFYAGLSTVKCEFTLLNSQAAKHPGGVWDLGDKGSFFFKELSVKI
jgi:hypothetical protein